MKREENQTVEYKESWHEKYLEWICGYANAKGGTLYIGVEDGTKKPVGVKNANKLMEDIPNSIRNTMGIVADVANPLVADIFSRLDFAERRGSGLGKIMDAYNLPLGNKEGRMPSFVSDTFFRAILPNMTYGLAKESLVAFAERGATPNSRPPNSRAHNPTVQVDRTSQPYKSAIQVSHTSRAVDVATAENRVGLVLSLLANGELSLRELMHAVGLRNRPSFYSLYILPAFEMGCVEYTIPDKPKSRLQKYRLTDKGRAALSASSQQ